MARSLARIPRAILKDQTRDLLQAPWRMLEAEHEKAMQNLHSLASLFLRLKGRKGTPKELETVRKALEFFRRDLVNHLESEEAAVFPYLRRHSPVLRDSLDKLVGEHRRIRHLLPRLASAYAAVRQRASSKQRWFIMSREGLKVVRLLQSHVAQEIQLMDDVR